MNGKSVLVAFLVAVMVSAGTGCGRDEEKTAGAGGTQGTETTQGQQGQAVQRNGSSSVTDIATGMILGGAASHLLNSSAQKKDESMRSGGVIYGGKSGNGGVQADTGGKTGAGPKASITARGGNIGGMGAGS